MEAGPSRRSTSARMVQLSDSDDASPERVPARPCVALTALQQTQVRFQGIRALRRLATRLRTVL